MLAQIMLSESIRLLIALVMASLVVAIVAVRRADQPDVGRRRDDDQRPHRRKACPL